MDDEEEQIPAYAMIPAGGDAADVSGADDVYDAYDEDTHGAEDKTAADYQADGPSVIQTGAYSSSPGAAESGACCIQRRRRYGQECKQQSRGCKNVIKRGSCKADPRQLTILRARV